MKKNKDLESDRSFSFLSNNEYGGDNISFHYRYRKQIIIGIGILISIAITLIIILNNRKQEEPKLDALINIKEETKLKKNVENTEIHYKVDVKGEVNNPGIYTLNENSRVIDAIELAGGFTENANTTTINLSKKITDEMVIIIYSNTEVEDFKHTKEVEKRVIESCIQKDEESLKNDACINFTNELNNSLISLNTASLEELMSLSGIGETKAKDIIAYREENGGFKAIEEIMNVSGIGESLFAKIKENITI